MLRIGRHVSIAGGLSLSLDRASALGCTAMQIFVANARSWGNGSLSASAGEAAAFRKKRSVVDIRPVCAHMPYLPNLASPNYAIFKKSVRALKENLAVCNSLGIEYLIAHMGSHMGRGRENGARRILAAIDSVAEVIGNVTILLENQAGHANSTGSSMEELASVYDASALAAAGGLGLCIDTCHAFAAGYDIGDRNVLRHIDRVLGFSKVPVLHVNDAKFGLGSHRDRHDNIGMGQIGIERFRTLLNYHGIASKALILETAPNPAVSESWEINTLRALVRD